jgi:two-component system NarL family response regulator
MKNMKVLLVDDHPLFLDGLTELLTRRGFEIVGTARDGFEALEQARRLHPQVILMDIKMPRCNGLAATRLIKAELPDIKIVMLTMSSDDEDLFESIKSGASGYLLKTQDTEGFLRLLTGIANGELPLSPGLAAKLLAEFTRQATEPEHTQALVSPPVERLSTRQLQVLTLVAQGLTYKEVGTKLGLTEATIKYHMGEIVDRLHLENRAQALEYARRMSLSPRE